jgi:hypothetical protein
VSGNPVEDLIVVDIDAPPQAVWEFRLDSKNLSLVNSEVSNIDRLDSTDGPVRAGARYICEIDFGAGRLLSTIDVLNAEPAKSIIFETESWPFSADGGRPSPTPGTGLRAREDLSITETSSGGSHVEVHLTVWPGDDLDGAAVEQLRRASIASITKEIEGIRPFLDQP